MTPRGRPPKYAQTQCPACEADLVDGECAFCEVVESVDEDTPYDLVESMLNNED